MEGQLALTDELLVTLRPAHERLERHFQQLRAERNEFGGATPIFALEHGLGAAEIDALSRAVRRSLSDEGLTRHWWLPWVVYAAEIGYRYTGEEYWQTFEALTPNWTIRGDRHYIRRKFQDFATRFGGAQPSGAWAEQFSIICWPITHAVLPTDLQLNLARLLYESRHHLTPDLLAKPDELGRRLAAGSWDSSARFRNFAQNTALVGQVAAALLLGEESKSSLLLSSTLVRVVTDLSHERQARRWLNDAKTSATRIHLRGFSSAPGEPRASGADRRVGDDGSPRIGGIDLFLTAVEAGWALSVEMPDLTPLAARSPELREVLANSRCIVAGVDGAPLARGQLLYSGKRVRLDFWPGSTGPLLRLEPSKKSADELLADECRLSRGPVWLFKVSDESAIEVKGKAAHPGQRYVLLIESEFGPNLPSWVTRSEVACKGLVAYDVITPSKLDGEDIARLESFGLAVVTEISMRPVGLVPASWDGDSFVEWIEGDRPILAVSSTLDIDRLAASLDDAPLGRLNWPDDKAAVYLSLGDLEVGVHSLNVLLAPKTAPRIVEGKLQISVRPRRIPTATGTYREPLFILANPAMPGLRELWEGKASLEILGPPGIPVTVTASLERGGNAPALTRGLRGLRLPVDRETWLKSFDEQFRQQREMLRYYDDATACVVVAAHPELGSTTLRCEREFAPLRWAVGQDHDGPFVRLHDNLGDRGLVMDRFEFSKPDQETRITASQGERLRFDKGALFAARVGQFSAGVVLPARVRDLADLGRANVQVTIAPRQRTQENLTALARLARTWSSASLPGNPMAVIPRDLVLRAITETLAATLQGQQWAAAERRIAAGDPAGLSVLAYALPMRLTRPQVPLWMTVERNAKSVVKLPLERRVATLQASLMELAPQFAPSPGDTWAAEALLRLASCPDTLLDWAPEGGTRAFAIALASPIAFGAARCFVLGTQLTVTQAAWSTSTVGGWEWQ